MGVDAGAGVMPGAPLPLPLPRPLLPLRLLPLRCGLSPLTRLLLLPPLPIKPPLSLALPPLLLLTSLLLPLLPWLPGAGPTAPPFAGR
jgi:hypothetical protein